VTKKSNAEATIYIYTNEANTKPNNIVYYANATFQNFKGSVVEDMHESIVGLLSLILMIEIVFV
jgi:hypothetical protein